MRPVAPGTVRPATPTPPPHTPFQPGASPSPPLSPVVAGLGLLLAAGQALWGLLNFRPPGTPAPLVAGDVLIPNGGFNQSFSVWWQVRTNTSASTNCSTGVITPASSSTAGVQKVSLFTAKVRILRTTVGSEQRCAAGSTAATNVTMIEQENQAGVKGLVLVLPDGGIQGGGSQSFQNTQTLVGFGQEIGFNNFVPLPKTPIPGTFAPGTRPLAPPPSEPEVAPAPAPRRPSPLVAPPPVVPLLPGTPAVPGVVPRPGQRPVQFPGKVPVIPPAPSTSPAIRPAQPAPLAVPAVGPAVRPAPPVVPVTPVDVVVVDGEVIGGPGQAPRADMIGIAAELGRIERKTENLMRRPENGGPGELAEEGILGALRDKLQQLLDELLNDVAGGSYQLTRPCPAPGGGEPLPPIVVPYPGGTNPIEALSGKLDGIAGLIQAHKDIGQPTCITPVTGEEVTVHFESP